jgi:hypothetical protein
LRRIGRPQRMHAQEPYGIFADNLARFELIASVSDQPQQLEDSGQPVSGGSHISDTPESSRILLMSPENAQEIAGGLKWLTQSYAAAGMVAPRDQNGAQSPWRTPSRRITSDRDGCRAARFHRKQRTVHRPAMSDTADTAQVIIHPPIARALAVLAGLALHWLMPLPFVPGMLPADWLGATVFALALALAAWAIATMTRAGSNVPTNRPSTTIVETAPTASRAIPSMRTIVS